MSNRPPYEKPTILRHQSGLANKFGRGVVRPTLPRIDGVELMPLLERFGSPLFVFSEATLRRKIREAQRAFSLRYPKVQFAWSYKTNYLDAICAVFHSQGFWAEVVSEMEYEMARRLGIPGKHILFNGPYKPTAALRTALEEGAHLHLDHYDELYQLEQLATAAGRTVPVSLRLNMDTGIYPRWDRFGFNLDSGEAKAAVRRLHAGGKLTLEGLHCHLGTFILDPEAYRKQATKLADFALELRKELDITLRYLDVGGGFASRATLHSQYSPGSDASPAIDQFAEAITGALMAASFPTDALPTLVLETGRALIDEAGTVVSRVVANKRLPDGVRSLVIDAGVNVLFTSFWYRHEVVPVLDRGGLMEETVVYGPLCMNIDVVRPSVLLPPLQVGDALAIHPVGAYNVTQWLQFIRLRPAVVLIGESGEVDLIRTAETLDNLKAPERLPERLRQKGDRLSS